MTRIMVIIVINASVAQLELERHASNVEVAGSSPARGANDTIVSISEL